MNRTIKVIAIIIVLMLVQGLGALAAAQVPVSINAPDRVAQNTDFTVNVNIGAVVELNAVQYDISYDTAVLRLDRITAGQIGSTAIPVQSNQISPGTWRVVQYLVGTASGSGYLSVLQFHVIGSAGQTSNINLSNGLLSGLNGQIPATWNKGSVSIAPAGTGKQELPSPTSSPSPSPSPSPAPAPSASPTPSPKVAPSPTPTPAKTPLPTSPPPQPPTGSATPGAVETKDKGEPMMPTTADSTNWLLWGTIGGIAIVGLIVYLILRKRSYGGY